MKIEFVSNPEADDIEAIRSGLAGYNQPHLESTDEKAFGLFVRDDNDTVIGGMTGTTFKESLHVRFFWLSEPIRGQGLGRELIQTIEAEARNRGINNLYLDTYTFQAPEFYQAAGFKEVGRYTDFPRKGVDKIFYQKTLD